MRAQPLRFLLAVALAIPAAASAQSNPTPASAPAPRPKPAQLPADSLQLGRTYAGWLLDGRIDSLFAHMDSASRSEIGNPRAMDAEVLELAMRAGTETALVGERWVMRKGHRQYWRTSNVTILPEPLLVRFVIDPTGRIMGWSVGPASEAPPIDP